jgi:GPN-loop GTPase
VRLLTPLQGVMSTLGLGPNGAIIYSIEFLEKNLDWLIAKLAPLRGKYLLFDFPGQVSTPAAFDFCTMHTSA